MTEKLQPPSTQTATPTQSLSSFKPFSPPIPPVSIPSARPAAPSPSSAAVTSDNVIAALTGAFPPAQDAVIARSESVVEEEPYTIKCICGFSGDDGNTIYCEICDSWQHIECFYPNNSEEATREEFSHACHECKPRPLDQKHAIAYQRRRLDAATAEVNENFKPKRPLSKNHSHKKKPKPTDLQLNGHGHSVSDVSKPQSAQSAHESPHLPHPSKKAKSSHKSSQSLGGAHSKRSPSYSAARTNFQNGHPLSPATTPPDLPDGVETHDYSSDFLSLCSEQSAAQIVQTNSFASLAVSNTMSIWLREPAQMHQDIGHDYSEVFHQPLPGAESSRPPKVEAKTRTMGHDPLVRWSYLAASEAVDKDVRLMELNGQVGFQKDYCAVAINRYEELSCPLPFVFFHPLLPLYIDTRREGSAARYARRSCRPNAQLDTFLSGGSEYHFWLLSYRRIEANEQITIPWDFRLPHGAKTRMLRILGLRDDDNNSVAEDLDVEEDEYNNIARWVHLILSEYGGCACDLGPECAFARFHRNYGSRALQTHGAHQKKKGARKAKPHAPSPMSNGHTSNSRAASEGHLDELIEHDKVSTSSRSKPPSRDMTPAPRQGSFDTLGILTEPTDRDKRKVAMVEDSFRRLEQQPPRKKKRTSDGGVSEKSASSHSKSKSKHSPTLNGHAETNGTFGRYYVDAGTSRGEVDSPIGGVSPQLKSGANGFATLPGRSVSVAVSRHSSAGPPSSYCDASVQTEPTTGEWYSRALPTPRLRRRVVSLSRRLLSHHRLRLEARSSEKLREQSEQSAKEQPESPESPAPPATPLATPATEPSAMLVDSHDDDAQQARTPVAVAESSSSGQTEDVLMTDAASTPPTVHSPAAPITQPTSPRSPVVEKVAATSTPVAKKSPDLRVQLPPAKSSEIFAEAKALVQTPLSGASLVQSPSVTAIPIAFGAIGINGAVATPSPVKKKMSLSDYTKSRKAAGSRPSVGTLLKPSVPNTEEAKPTVGETGTGAGEAPTPTEKATETAPTTATVAPAFGST